MTKPGWKGLSLSDEWIRWIDQFLEDNPHGLKSRAQVVEFALKQLRDGQKLATKDDVEAAVERIFRRLRDGPKKP